MAVRFYCDESEDRESKVLSLAGFLGTGEDMDALQEEWVARLKPTGVSAYHMTDCDNGGGEFSDAKGWNKTDRTHLTIDLIEIIARHKVFLVGLSVLLDDYRTIPSFPGTDKLLGFDTWHLLFQGIFMYAEQLLGTEAPPEETIACFFDWRQKTGRAQTIFEIMRDIQDLPFSKRLGTLTFGHKEFDKPGSIPLLQIADIAAVETRKDLANPITHPHLPERRSLARLRQTGRVWLLHLDKLVLEGMYEMKKAQLGFPHNAEEAFLKCRIRTLLEMIKKNDKPSDSDEH
jgi:hypothetical protein